MTPYTTATAQEDLLNAEEVLKSAGCYTTATKLRDVRAHLAARVERGDRLAEAAEKYRARSIAGDGSSGPEFDAALAAYQEPQTLSGNTGARTAKPTFTATTNRRGAR